MRRVLCVLGVGTALGLSAATPVPAAPGAASFGLLPQHYDPSLPVTRSYFVAQALPGETFANSVRVKNLGTRTGTALLYAVDATTGQTSGTVYLDRTRPRRGAGAWIALGARSVTLAPGQSRVVPITVHVPAGARPGDHLGGIVAENEALTGASGKGALQIRVRHLTITAVVVQIPGPAPARVDVTAARAGGEHGYQYVYLHLASTGAVATKPRGRVVVSSAAGKEVAARNFRLDTVVPGTVIDYPVLLPGLALEPGAYRATVELTYGAAAIGYRRTGGTVTSVTRSLPFRVTSGQYASVFKGLKPVAPKQRAATSDGFPLVLVVAVIAALLTLVAVVVVLVRRWPAR